MEHYVETGEILGKGTHNLEGYALHPEASGQYVVGYFGPGELPIFDAKFFDIPKGTRENAALEVILDEIKAKGPDSQDDVQDEMLYQFRDRLRQIVHGGNVSDSTMF